MKSSSDTVMTKANLGNSNRSVVKSDLSGSIVNNSKDKRCPSEFDKLDYRLLNPSFADENHRMTNDDWRYSTAANNPLEKSIKKREMQEPVQSGFCCFLFKK